MVKNQKEKFLVLRRKNRKYFEEANGQMVLLVEDYDSEKEKQKLLLVGRDKESLRK